LIEQFHLLPTKIQVVENGIDTEHLRPAPIRRQTVRQELNIQSDEQVFVFFGSFTYPPNFQAARIIVSEIVPRLAKLVTSAKVLLIGNGPQPLETTLKIEGVSVMALGFVDDLVSYITSADVMIAPLKAGSGTRFKILETLACGVPVVTTVIGAEGIERQVCGEHLLVCDDWDLFAQKAVDQTKLEASLPEAFFEKYDWKQIVSRISL